MNTCTALEKIQKDGLIEFQINVSDFNVSWLKHKVLDEIILIAEKEKDHILYMYEVDSKMLVKILDGFVPLDTLKPFNKIKKDVIHLAITPYIASNRYTKNYYIK